jgi:large subunit ribosomal protein L15
VKLLGDGEVNRKLTVKVDKASRSAVEKVAAAGGSVEV